MKAWIAYAAVIVPSLAFATGDRIVVLAASGGAPAVRAQLVETLCTSEECVAPEAVQTAGKLDWAKVAREHVTAVVESHASRTKEGAVLLLSVLGAGGAARMEQSEPLNESNRLSVKDLVAGSALLLSAIDAGDARHPAAAKPGPKALAHNAKAKPTRHLAARPHPGHAHG